MTKNLSSLALAVLTTAGALCCITPAAAQVAGSITKADASITESTQLATGWSVKKTLMGKTIYNEAGNKVGKVEDLIISPDARVSYVIVGAGGFVGIDRHDVAIPVTRITDQAGKLVMSGATKDMIKGMPEFTYAELNSRRDAFVAAAATDIASGKTAVAHLEKEAGAAGGDAKVRLEVEITALRSDVQSAEAKLSEMKQASAARWKAFEADVSAATARLRKTTAKAMG